MKVILDGVTKKYDLDTLGIENVGFTADGVTGIVGEAGSGKTTLLYVIGGIADIDGGEIFFDGKKMNGVPPKDRDVVLVSDTRPIGGSVRRALGYGLKLRRYPREEIRRRVEAAAEMFGFSERSGENVRALGAEDRVRLGLARAAARKAKVVLIDEPYAGVDEKRRAALYADIKRLAEYTGGAVFVASSDGADAAYTGETVHVLRDGRVIRSGSFAELTTDPRTAYVAGYVGETPVNIVRTEEGAFAVGADGALITEGDGVIVGVEERGQGSVVALRLKEDEPPFILYTDKRGLKTGDRAGCRIIKKILLTDEPKRDTAGNE